MSEPHPPGQPYADQPVPGQPYAGQPVPGQVFPGQPVPGQVFPGQPVPGQPYPGPWPQAPQGPPQGIAFSTRLVAMAWTAMVAMMALSMWFVLGTGYEPYRASPVGIGVPIALALATHGLIQLVGYRTAPLVHDAPAPDLWRRARSKWWVRMFLRMLLTDIVLFGSISTAFLVGEGGSYLTALLGIVATLVLLVLHGWPRRATVERVATALEAQGAPSGLRESFGYAPH